MAQDPIVCIEGGKPGWKGKSGHISSLESYHVNGMKNMGCLSWAAEACTSAKFTNLFEKRLNYTAYLLLPHRQMCCTSRYIAKVAGGDSFDSPKHVNTEHLKWERRETDAEARAVLLSSNPPYPYRWKRQDDNIPQGKNHHSHPSDSLPFDLIVQVTAVVSPAHPRGFGVRPLRREEAKTTDDRRRRLSIHLATSRQPPTVRICRPHTVVACPEHER